MFQVLIPFAFQSVALGYEVVVVKLHWRNGATIGSPTELGARIRRKIVKERLVQRGALLVPLQVLAN